MIGWLHPALLAGLAAIVFPILVHLLRRHRAERLPFPSLRFVRASPPASVALGPPADFLLLIVRAATIAMAALALAGPVFITSSRLAAWNARLARVVVVDSSGSMQQASTAAAAAEAASAEEKGAAWSRRVESADLHTGLLRAVAALQAAPPARREIVVLSDFQEGAIGSHDLAVVPAGVGVRLVRAGALPESRRITGLLLLASGGGVTKQDLTLRGSSTALRLVPGGPGNEGLELLTGGDAEGAAALLNTVAAAGAPAPDPSTPLVVAFRGAALPAVQPVPPGWMLRLSVHVALDPDVRAVADAADAGQSARDEEPWFALVRDRQQRPLIRAASTERALVLDVAAPPDALLSAATVRAALSVREADTAARDEEVQPIADRQLGEWSRPPAAVDRDIWRSAEPSDARWCWAAALALLALETVVRRQRQHREEARAHAA